MALASMPWTVGIVARSWIEQGLLLVNYVGVLDRIRSPRHWVQYENIKKENCFENTCITRRGHAATPV